MDKISVQPFVDLGQVSGKYDSYSLSIVRKDVMINSGKRSKD